MNKNVELLAPAGNLKSVYGAINAGADAVYLGAPSFSARAYADNLSIEEIIMALDYAHIHGRKIYLALNILLKEEEISEAVKIVNELYKEGLDGIIVQDMGLLAILKELFPKLELHGSTQMAVTSSHAVPYLREKGICRIVPARELSLNEIKAITSTGMDVECFIHGAMCYSYSGKCLFSSMAGGRSGNRGRCAGTCRKTYDTYIGGVKVNSKKDIYPLSMRDMCVAEYIPDLIDAGVKSFKIEGRMKAPEYAAGVTAIYRKIIDDYLNCGKKPDVNKINNALGQLYMRSETSTGYLFKHNGPDMITMSSPSYKGINNELIKDIQDRYLTDNLTLPVDIYFDAFLDSAIELTAVCGEYTVTVNGDVPEKASKTGTDESSIKKQLAKTGGTYFKSQNIYVQTDGLCFIPVSIINNLRRQLLENLQKTILADFKRNSIDTEHEIHKFLDRFLLSDNKACNLTNENNLIFSVNNMQQLEIVVHYPFVKKIIVSFEVAAYLAKLNKEYYPEITGGNIQLYFKMPPVIRENNSSYIVGQLKIIKDSGLFEKVYAGNLDALGICRQIFNASDICGDSGIYVFNNYSAVSLENDITGYTASYELSKRELNVFRNKQKREMIIYGYVPLMYSAGCILSNFKGCNSKSEEQVYICDEKGRKFRVLMNHRLCYNTIFNYVPLRMFAELKDMVYYNDAVQFRIEFTIENNKQTSYIMEQVFDLINNESNNVQADDKVLSVNNKKSANKCNSDEYTWGHYKRGVQ